MPAFTPDRTFRYPTGGDPVDTANDVHQLAETIDYDTRRHGTARTVSNAVMPPGPPTYLWTPINWGTHDEYGGIPGWYVDGYRVACQFPGMFMLQLRATFTDPAVQGTIGFNIDGVLWPRVSTAGQYMNLCMSASLGLGQSVTAEVFSSSPAPMTYSADWTMMRMTG